MKITEANFKSIFPNIRMSFKTIVDGRFAPHKTMNAQNSFQQIRYLEPEDLITIAEKRIETDSGPNKAKNKAKWEEIIEISGKIIFHEVMTREQDQIQKSARSVMRRNR